MSEIEERTIVLAAAGAWLGEWTSGRGSLEAAGIDPATLARMDDAVLALLRAITEAIEDLNADVRLLADRDLALSA